MGKAKSKLKYFLSLSISSFLILILIFSALPAILLLLKIPSFTLGENFWWILRWKNETDGSGINFNFFMMIFVAIAVGLFSMFWRSRY